MTITIMTLSYLYYGIDNGRKFIVLCDMESMALK